MILARHLVAVGRLTGNTGRGLRGPRLQGLCTGTIAWASFGGYVKETVRLVVRLSLCLLECFDSLTCDRIYRMVSHTINVSVYKVP